VAREINEECGVFGIYCQNHVAVAPLTYLGLFALQHRGQESSGMAVTDGRQILLHKGTDLVPKVFSEEKIKQLKGYAAIGHVRYSTTGSNLPENAQPLVVDSSFGQVALAHNGNLTNSIELRRQLTQGGAVFNTSTDTELIINLMAQQGGDLETALVTTAQQLAGAFSLVVLTKERLIGIRDPLGFRPLVLGARLDGYLLASESCALTNLGAEVLREIQPGEMVIIDQDGIRFHKYAERQRESFCVFEYVYFARPDSNLMGQSVHQVRKRIGAALWKEAPVEADVVIAAPDSGTPAAMGFAEASGLPFEIGLLKNRYIGRTFIEPSQQLRELGVRIKLNPIEAVIRNKRVVIIDDSIVRGTTSAKIVRLLRETGAKEVHMYAASPPYLYPCYYGIDTSQGTDLVAAKYHIDEIKRLIGADTLRYLSLKGLVEAVGIPQERLCLACFNGDYPLPIQGITGKHCFEKDGSANA
jgi:amidophosphoribosyltransferase